MPEQRKVDSRWVRYRVISYLRGRGLQFGVPQDIYPWEATDGGKYSLTMDVRREANTDILDADLGIIARNSLDHVFIGNRITEVPIRQEMLQAFVERLKEGGHLAIHIVGDAEWVRSALSGLAYWQEKDTYQRDGQFLGIWKLVGKQRRGILPPKTRAQKRACICRYGAIGDMIMISPLIHRLADDGYEVTLNITPYCAEVLKHNPYVHNIVLQERDAIPNPDLGAYWAEWKDDYDKYINLSESIEGKLLKVEGRRDFYTSKAWREEQVGQINYYDHTMKLGGYPEALGTRGELYFSRAEEKEVQHIRQNYKDKFLILWALKGSSHHKQYPMLPDVLGGWLDAHPDAQALLCGGPGDKKFAFEHPQVKVTCGDLPLRMVFGLTKVANCVGGPESAIVNAASCFDTPKLTLLSHSNHSNLCKYWTNDYCMVPDVDCAGCHQLHYSLESCPIIRISNSTTNETLCDAPACAAIGISPERLQARLDEVYVLWKSQHQSPATS